jgi:hypothetical protein
MLRPSRYTWLEDNFDDVASRFEEWLAEQGAGDP